MINYYELVVNNPAYFKQFSCNNLLFLNYDCPVKVKKASKWSEHNYIYYVLSGKKTLHTIDNSVTLTKGSIALIKKGACIIEQYFEEPFCIVVFIMPDSFIRSFLKDYITAKKTINIETPPIITLHDDVMIREFYQSILPYFATADHIPADILELKFKELLLHLMHNPDNKDLYHYFLTIDESATPIAQIMETNYAYNLGIEAYARMTNRSVSSFKRDFQSVYHTTPGRWLIDKKLHRAKKLLIQSDMAISDVAYDSGFENTTHFCRLFKQKSGLTPLEYRKKSPENAVLAF